MAATGSRHASLSGIVPPGSVTRRTISRSAVRVVVVIALLFGFSIFMRPSSSPAPAAFDGDPTQYAAPFTGPPAAPAAKAQARAQLVEEQQKAKLPPTHQEKYADLYGALAERGRALDANTGVPKLCVIARTYASQLPYLPSFLLGIFHTGFPDVQVFLVNTDGAASTDKLEQASNFVNEVVGRANFSRFMDFDGQILGNGPDYGYSGTDYVLQKLYDEGDSYNCQYLMVTNADNIYTSGMASHLLPAFQASADLVAWRFISHYQLAPVSNHYDKKRKATMHDDGSFNPFETEIAVDHIDLGAVCYKFEFLRERKMLFIDRKAKKYHFNADGRFAARAHGLSKNSWIFKQVLFVHQ